MLPKPKMICMATLKKAKRVSRARKRFIVSLPNVEKVVNPPREWLK